MEGVVLTYYHWLNRQIGAVNRLQWSNATWNETKTTPPYRNGMPFVVEYYSVEDFTTQHLDPSG